jgi:nitrogen fixation protein NifU and related proteins
MSYREELSQDLREKIEKWAEDTLEGTGIFKGRIAGYEGYRETVISQLRKRYSDKTIELFLNPQNDRRIESPDAFASISEKNGHTMEFYVKTDGNKISDISFHTDGCRVYISSGEVTSRYLKDKTINEAINFSRDDIIRELGGLPKEEYHCATFAVKALKEALKNI